MRAPRHRVPSGEVQKAQRRAAFATSLRHLGHSLAGLRVQIRSFFGELSESGGGIK